MRRRGEFQVAHATEPDLAGEVMQMVPDEMNKIDRILGWMGNKVDNFEAMV